MFHSVSPGPLLGQIKAQQVLLQNWASRWFKNMPWSREEEKEVVPECGLFIAPKSGLEKPGGTAGKEPLPFSITLSAPCISNHPFPWLSLNSSLSQPINSHQTGSARDDLIIQHPPRGSPTHNPPQHPSVTLSWPRSSWLH